ncbi:hypothetical protein [Cytobacillus sp. NCCP-133]|uniref:hypothetical protein n=1 Tax=Cytobacillus sp. NCCP-133 TaxID=766848 RepID=UPI00223118CD|nr:hypothetical protein [Cytobacillus sp. NCCP-133]GLB58680.1 hypothetical protein NCCP133_08130 [Cytobacillus sp. NCCP-133]
MLQVFIDGNEVDVQAGSLSWERNTTDFDNLSFNIFTFREKDFFEEGQEVELYNNGKLQFGGEILTVGESGARNNYLVHRIDCVGHEKLLENRTIAKAYELEYSGDIIAYMSNDILFNEGIQPGVIERGLLLNEVRFGYISCLQAIQSLAERSNYWFRIDQFKKLHFRSKSGYPSPFPLRWDNVISDSLNVEKGNSEYRNTQYLLGSQAVTSERTEEKKGNGTNTEFIIGFPLAKKPKIYVSRNGGPFEEQTVGPKGVVDTGYDFFVALEDNVIVQDKIGTPLTETDVIRIVYQGFYNIVVKSQINYEINKRNQKGRGTGIVERVETASYRGEGAARQANLQILNKYATQDCFVITYETELDGLEPGMMQPVHLPEHNITNVEGLITSISASDDNGVLVYSVRCVRGPVDQDWTAFFSKPKRDVDTNIIEGDELIQPVYSYEKTWTQGEFPNLFATGVYPSNTTFPSSTLYPSLSPSQKIKFLAYFIGDVEAGRIPITQQDIKSDSVFTICLMGFDVEGVITKLAWVGGYSATEQLGTGIYLDIQNVNLIKTDMEIFQIEKIDRKGW